MDATPSSVAYTGVPFGAEMSIPKWNVPWASSLPAMRGSPKKARTGCCWWKGFRGHPYEARAGAATANTSVAAAVAATSAPRWICEVADMAAPSGGAETAQQRPRNACVMRRGCHRRALRHEVPALLDRRERAAGRRDATVGERDELVEAAADVAAERTHGAVDRCSHDPHRAGEHGADEAFLVAAQGRDAHAALRVPE